MSDDEGGFFAVGARYHRLSRDDAAVGVHSSAGAPPRITVVVGTSSRGIGRVACCAVVGEVGVVAVLVHVAAGCVDEQERAQQ